jgi:hypothetical protein
MREKTGFPAWVASRRNNFPQARKEGEPDFTSRNLRIDASQLWKEALENFKKVFAEHLLSLTDVMVA